VGAGAGDILFKSIRDGTWHMVIPSQMHHAVERQTYRTFYREAFLCMWIVTVILSASTTLVISKLYYHHLVTPPSSAISNQTSWQQCKGDKMFWQYR